MPELRKDPIVKRWVIIAKERSKRPSDYKNRNGDHPDLPDGNACPFCPGNESMTPPEITSYHSPAVSDNEKRWWVRVVPNRFPALMIEEDPYREGIGIYDKMGGVGAHEVIIETPEHELHMGDMTKEQLYEVLWCYRERCLDLKKDKRFRYVLIFKNFGVSAGASLAHPHSQLIATPIVPMMVENELEGALHHYREKERCIFCDILKQEEDSGSQRVVVQNDSFMVISPFASRFPFESWLFPKFHSARYEKLKEDHLRSLAEILKDILHRMEINLHNPSFNFMLHTAPCREDRKSGFPYDDYFHWHIEIIPRLVTPAGFEWGSGFYINPTSPEDAARYLRETNAENVK